MISTLNLFYISHIAKQYVPLGGPRGDGGGGNPTHLRVVTPQTEIIDRRKQRICCEFMLNCDKIFMTFLPDITQSIAT